MRLTSISTRLGLLALLFVLLGVLADDAIWANPSDTTLDTPMLADAMFGAWSLPLALLGITCELLGGLKLHWHVSHKCKIHLNPVDGAPERPNVQVHQRPARGELQRGFWVEPRRPSWRPELMARTHTRPNQVEALHWTVHHLPLRAVEAVEIVITAALLVRIQV